MTSDDKDRNPLGLDLDEGAVQSSEADSGPRMGKENATQIDIDDDFASYEYDLDEDLDQDDAIDIDIAGIQKRKLNLGRLAAPLALLAIVAGGGGYIVANPSVLDFGGAKTGGMTPSNVAVPNVPVDSEPDFMAELPQPPAAQNISSHDGIIPRMPDALFPGIKNGAVNNGNGNGDHLFSALVPDDDHGVDDVASLPDLVDDVPPQWDIAENENEDAFSSEIHEQGSAVGSDDDGWDVQQSSDIGYEDDSNFDDVMPSRQAASADDGRPAAASTREFEDDMGAEIESVRPITIAQNFDGESPMAPSGQAAAPLEHQRQPSQIPQQPSQPIAAPQPPAPQPVPHQAAPQPAPSQVAPVMAIPPRLVQDPSGVIAPNVFYESAFPREDMSNIAGPRRIDPAMEPAQAYVIVESVRGTSDPETRLEAARRALNLGRYDAALEMYNELYARNKRDPRILMGRAIAQQNVGMTASAIRSYEEVLELSPNNAEAMINMLGLMRTEYPEVATRRMKDMTRQFPDHPGLAAQIGITEGERGNYVEAIRYLTAASSLEPHNASHFFNMAVIADRQGKTAEAIRYYEQALTIDSVHGAGRSIPRDSIHNRLLILRRR